MSPTHPSRHAILAGAASVQRLRCRPQWPLHCRQSSNRQHRHQPPQ
jgi:hypothetical protein